MSGSWIVPAVTPPATNPSGQTPQCAVWVGIDGLDNNTVEQVGTDSYVIGSKAYYYAWTEMYPAGMTEIAPIALRVSAGDSMTASVQYSPPGYPNQFLLTITDNTTGKSYWESWHEFLGIEVLGGMDRRGPDLRKRVGRENDRSAAELRQRNIYRALAMIGTTTGTIVNNAWDTVDVTMQNGSDAMSPGPLATAGSGASASSGFTVFQTPEPSALAGLAAAAAVAVLSRFGSFQFPAANRSQDLAGRCGGKCSRPARRGAEP